MCNRVVLLFNWYFIVVLAGLFEMYCCLIGTLSFFIALFKLDYFIFLYFIALSKMVLSFFCIS
jgi:hypothetical protein